MGPRSKTVPDQRNLYWIYRKMLSVISKIWIKNVFKNSNSMPKLTENSLYAVVDAITVSIVGLVQCFCFRKFKRFPWRLMKKKLSHEKSKFWARCELLIICNCKEKRLRCFDKSENFLFINWLSNSPKITNKLWKKLKHCERLR